MGGISERILDFDGRLFFNQPGEIRPSEAVPAVFQAPSRLYTLAPRERAGVRAVSEEMPPAASEGIPRRPANSKLFSPTPLTDRLSDVYFQNSPAGQGGKPLAKLIPENILDRIRDATDIVELISDYIPLKKALFLLQPLTVPMYWIPPCFGRAGLTVRS